MDNISAIRRGERAAAVALLGALRHEFGLVATARLLARLLAAKLRGEPFKQLGPPRDERDRLSRRQCGDLVLLDRLIRARSEPATALRLCRAAVLAGAVPFLDAMLPQLDVTQLASLAPALAESFFNAEGLAAVEEDGSFRFTVTRCRFVELLSAVDASHLMPLFCEADDHFFDGKRRPIQLRRATTLAGGDSHCDFRFSPTPEEAGRGG